MLFQTDMGSSTKLMLEEAHRAIELDPLDARAHAALGYATGMTGDLKQAEIEYNKALGLNPNSFDVLKSYACWAFAFGKGDAGAQGHRWRRRGIKRRWSVRMARMTRFKRICASCIMARASSRVR
jgi:hypothetical protein